MKVESKSTLQAIRQVILSACVFMEATQTAEGHSLTAVHVGSQGVTCLDSIKHMALMGMDEASVSVVTILVFLLLVMTLVICLAGLKFLRPPIQKHLRLRIQPLLNVVILILMMAAVPVRASESEDPKRKRHVSARSRISSESKKILAKWIRKYNSDQRDGHDVATTNRSYKQLVDFGVVDGLCVDRYTR